ncbi:MAG: tRNA pseudouridine(38-40) synthase TruA [Oscillospiraceae bacterium]|jgi:tRNA pseudouridine38-40 synthase|nr:tRNA pseudouridine(38-40) synthase TruA [Oscillospiraceae bacterium]
MRNIALKLRYDGTAYHGWQVQRPGVPTVGATLEAALSRVCGHEVKATGCGRTDAGVHALSYCAGFKTDCTIPVPRMPLAFNTALPDDISVLDACEELGDFNAILSCEKKEYIYKLSNTRIRDPFLQNRACFYPGALDYKRMSAACEKFVGTHDFAAVRSVGSETKSTVRTVFWCNIERAGDVYTMSVCADGFLYNMVRAIMGTVVWCGAGKIKPDDIPALLERGERRLAGPTMPPGGLYMSRVWYPGAAGLMFK